MRRRGYNLRHALVVGSGISAQTIARAMFEHPEFGVELAGFLNKDGAPVEVEPQQLSLLQQSSIEDDSLAVNVIGRYQDLPKILEEGKYDQIVVALPHNESDYLETIIASIGDEMIDVRIVPDVQQFIQLGSDIEEFNGVPIISLASTPLSGINRVLKRAFDTVFSTLLFIAFLPLMFCIALLVKLSSRGPIFFSQERLGLDGQAFQIYKFRTMALDAEAQGAQFAVRDDPRVTFIGGILRRTSLDELPQLLNVIKGNMSLVGPRPERPVFISDFRKRIPRYMLRHKVQAGMTGWAQVHGWRGNTSIEKRIEFDLYYIEHWSLMLDLKILFLTLIRGIRDRNAY